MTSLPKVLEAPDCPAHIDQKALWLAGEGAGSWFTINKLASWQYHISRFSPKGVLECEGKFLNKELFDINQPYEITYPSHCALVTLIQDDQLILFERILDE